MLGSDLYLNFSPSYQCCLYHLTTQAEVKSVLQRLKRWDSFYDIFRKASSMLQMECQHNISFLLSAYGIMDIFPLKFINNRYISLSRFTVFLFSPYTWISFSRQSISQTRARRERKAPIIWITNLKHIFLGEFRFRSLFFPEIILTLMVFGFNLFQNKTKFRKKVPVKYFF